MFENWQRCNADEERKKGREEKEEEEGEKESESKRRQRREASIPHFSEKNKSCSLSIADRGEREGLKKNDVAYLLFLS